MVFEKRTERRGKRATPLDLVTHPFWRFVQFYFLKAGFLDGWRGFLMACLAAHYVRLKYTKLLLLQRDSTPEETA